MQALASYLTEQNRTFGSHGSFPDQNFGSLTACRFPSNVNGLIHHHAHRSPMLLHLKTRYFCLSQPSSLCTCQLQVKESIGASNERNKNKTNIPGFIQNLFHAMVVASCFSTQLLLHNIVHARFSKVLNCIQFSFIVNIHLCFLLFFVYLKETREMYCKTNLDIFCSSKNNTVKNSCSRKVSTGYIHL